MNVTIIRALREFQLELMAINREYWNDSINTREYHDKQDSAMQRCKLKIEIALEEDNSEAAEREAQFLKDWGQHIGGMYNENHAKRKRRCNTH